MSKASEMIEEVLEGRTPRNVISSKSKCVSEAGLENLDGWDETDASIDGLIDGLKTLAKEVKKDQKASGKIKEALDLAKQIRKLVGGITMTPAMGA